MLTEEENKLIKELYIKNRIPLYNYIFSHLYDSELANDIVSEIFILACEKGACLYSHPNKTGWLYEAAKLKLLEQYKKLRKNKSLPYDFSSEQVYDVQLLSPYYFTELKYTLKCILTDDEFIRFGRYFIFGYSIPEMASLENITSSNMSVRITRLRNKLKNYRNTCF